MLMNSCEAVLQLEPNNTVILGGQVGSLTSETGSIPRPKLASKQNAFVHGSQVDALEKARQQALRRWHQPASKFSCMQIAASYAVRCSLTYF